MVTIQEERLLSEINTALASHVKIKNRVWKIDADQLSFKELNTLPRILDHHGVEKVEITNVYGQRYIGTDLKTSLKIDIHGTPGNDLAAFMNGPNITVYGNAQDCVANTMNEGQIIIHGRAGDITGYGMRGGKVFIRDDVGYRCGIHMKEYLDKKPTLVVGGIAQDFLGEYMAGGTLLVLGLSLKEDEVHKSRYVGTGMHGGVLYIRGEVNNLGKEVKVTETDEHDLTIIEGLVKEFSNCFDKDYDQIMSKKFVKIIPHSHRPYGRVYA
jgi:glutamate synthase domain-containing protein 3